MPFTRHLVVSPGITEGVNSARFAMGAAAVVLGVSMLAACTSARTSTSTTPDEQPHGPDRHRRVTLAEPRTRC